MRVVAGEYRGRKIVAPDGNDTRPTTDKVREAVFNALWSLDLVRDAHVVDLYAGSGAIGIEALSRGADHCTFVERDRRALGALHENLEALDLGDRSNVVSGDVMAVARAIDADIVFADPPYGFDAWPQLLGLITAPFVVAESGHRTAEVAGWSITRQKRYGRTWITFFERVDATTEAPEIADQGIDRASDAPL